LAALVDGIDDGDSSEWIPYLDDVPVDPWGNEFVYVYPGRDRPYSFDLFSMGPDGQPNTEDDVYPVKK
jgi:general secretion pathway protein G